MKTLKESWLKNVWKIRKFKGKVQKERGGEKR